MIRKSLNSLAGKLILAVGCLMALGSIIFGYIFIHYQETIMMKNLISSATATADLVKRGISRGMLAGDRDSIEKTVETIASGSGIRGITIFDMKGRITYSSKKGEVGRSVGKDYPTCQICHRDSEKPLSAIPDSENWRIVSDRSGTKTLTRVVPMANEPSCYGASCHYHREDQKILGVLETNVSMAAVDAAIAQSRIGTLLFGGLFIMIISVSLCIILYKFVSKPVSLLDEGMRKISKGNLDHVIEIPTNDEMGLLAQTFNSMAKDIKKYRESMENWTKALEEEVQKKKAEIVRAHDHLINAEKLASLGRMAAGVAHELNSPLTGIVTFAHLMQKRIPPENKQDIEDLEVIIEQANRCSKIIKSLLGFSRKTSAEKTLTDFNALLRNTISLVTNQAKFHNIKFNLTLESSLPSILADPNQMQQVFLNLLINAADAMNERGEVTVVTRLSDDSLNGRKQIEIEFSDTGPGIPPDHVGRIFEPFFTTKPIGKGTGLGLSVSYGIIKKHGGNIFVRSELGKGASFFVRLPLEATPGIG
ncbi:MAG TPA: ATP-binding protein [Thermodesulfovibrionales bacterium]|nr:ATP-binding protein [Thermodesulfovibrionales bacterium]